ADAAAPAAAARRVRVAVPVAPRETYDAFRQEGVEIVCVLVPDPFLAVGVWYRDFDPTTDDEVIRLLDRS
ncbi:MAG: phosphoribosyltransferase, partial [Gaiellaceae bacterium]